MADYIRRLVSGDKARFKDGNLNLELDLVYITDQVIIMGYPAAGIEGLYRNRREDARKFLEHRHGKNFWVFNFCPIRENSYPGSLFDGRVSRYPFPDHHAPPLAIMPLVAREMRIWLEGSPERVAVLHCKAGKGRSGTMACSYLLSLDNDPSPPLLERSYSAKQWAKIRAEDMMRAIPEDESDADINPTQLLSPDAPASGSTSTEDLEVGDKRTETPLVVSPTSAGPNSAKSFTDSLKGVLDLHTSRRMKSPSSPDKKVKQGVSIPSQRRWLYYWSLILAREAPPHLWSTLSSPKQRPKVRLTQIKLRMKETSGIQMNLVRAANLVIDRTSMGKIGARDANLNGKGHVWVSLARYDDEFVELLERWEAHTQDEVNMGKRKKGADHMGTEPITGLFEDGKWDKGKMVRSFARMGAVGDNPIVKEGTDKNGKTMVYTLHPLSDANWVDIRNELKDEVPEDGNFPASEANSMYDVTQGVNGDKGIVLDAGREVRVKLYLGQVFMGWLWFIPTFHMPHPLPTTSASQPQTPTKLLLTRKEVDFPIGVGSSLIDVEISLQWVPETDVVGVQPPARQTSAESESGGSEEPAGIVATLQAVTVGKFGDAVEAKQAAAD